MSDMERNKGILRPIEITEEEAQKICEKHGYNLYVDWITTLCAEHDDYRLINGIGVVKVEKLEKLDPNYFADVRKNEDGTFSFHTLHYNGGAHWSEVVEDALKKIL